MILTGSIVNFLGILLGGAVGLLIHRLLQKGIPERFSDMIMKGIGLCVLAIAFGGISSGSNTMITIFSMVVGCVIGEWIDLDGKLTALSGKLEKKFSKSGDASFSKGFMTATLLFCVGTMAIKGSLDSGLLGNHDILIAKSVMDTISAVIFAFLTMPCPSRHGTSSQASAGSPMSTRTLSTFPSLTVRCSVLTPASVSSVTVVLSVIPRS